MKTSVIDFFKKRKAVLVFLITFLVYSPTLFNQFVGDDNIILGRNTFYHSWKNIPRVFGAGYISNYREINFNSDAQVDFGTACDTYRPISNLTYFIDGHFFQAKPYGSHLINILIHCINSALVYVIVNQVFSSPILGIFAGLLFSLHPMQTEAVSIVSERRDILTAMFALFSFYFWIRFRQDGYVMKKYYYGSLAMCCLALFSKESAITFPFLVPLFDQVLAAPFPGIKQKVHLYIGFIMLFIFYLFLYFIIFPNGSLSVQHAAASGTLALNGSSRFLWLGGSFINHCLIMGFIWCNWLMNVLMPWTVKAVPAHYHPPVPGVMSLVTAEIMLVSILFILSIYLLLRKSRECCFFLLWFIILYLPVSNLVPLSNPMESRYMYLPSIGLLIVLAFFLHKAFDSAFLRKYSPYLSGMLHGAVIMICLTRTFSSIGDWRSNFDAGWGWVRDYPADGQGYALLGEEYLNAEKFDKAKEYLEKSVLLGNQVPSDVSALGECYMLLGQYSAAEQIFKQINLHYPDYPDPLFYLGETYYEQKNNQQAQGVLEKALMLNPKRASGYILLMNVYINLHKFGAAKDLLNKAGRYLDAQTVTGLRHLLEKSI